MPGTLVIVPPALVPGASRRGLGNIQAAGNPSTSGFADFFRSLSTLPGFSASDSVQQPTGNDALLELLKPDRLSRREDALAQQQRDAFQAALAQQHEDKIAAQQQQILQQTQQAIGFAAQGQMAITAAGERSLGQVMSRATLLAGVALVLIVGTKIFAGRDKKAKPKSKLPWELPQ